jgi:protein-S-isoprenylcysteine O-methyltransferase Ste14
VSLDAIATAVIVAGGVIFIAFAQLARSRAVAARGASVRTAGGLPQLLPYFFWVPYVVVALRPGPNLARDDWVVAVGCACAVLGIAFALWAIVTLGRHYDLLLEVHTGHELVRDGPYRIVRHPVYTGLGLHFIGACIATGNVLLIAGTLAVTFPGFYLRARAEERLLREQFGAEYDTYAKRVGMLAPFR